MNPEIKKEHPLVRFVREEMLKAGRNITQGSGPLDYQAAYLRRRCVEMYMKYPMAEA